MCAAVADGSRWGRKEGRGPGRDGAVFLLLPGVYFLLFDRCAVTRRRATSSIAALGRRWPMQRRRRCFWCAGCNLATLRPAFIPFESSPFFFVAPRLKELPLSFFSLRNRRASALYSCYCGAASTYDAGQPSAVGNCFVESLTFVTSALRLESLRSFDRAAAVVRRPGLAAGISYASKLKDLDVALH